MISKFFIERPVLANVLAILMVVIGAVALWSLPVAQYPDVTPPTVHRMTAIEDCDIFEVSTPELDDVVRLEDRYGRTGTSAP